MSIAHCIVIVMTYERERKKYIAEERGEPLE